MNLRIISVLATILSFSNLISTLPTNAVEDYSNVNYFCLTAVSTELRSCSTNIYSVGFPLKTRECLNLCSCTYGGSRILAVQCQPYFCCTSRDIFNACSGLGQFNCYSWYKRDGGLVEMNATMAVEDVTVPGVC